MIEIREATTNEDLEAVRGLWRAYWTEHGFTPCFQGFDQEMAGLPGRYAPPGGRLLIALSDGQAAGAVAYRRLDSSICEAKRLYVSPDYRGKGIGAALMTRLLSDAQAAGYSRVVGDTMPVMATALGMYERMGFERIEPYPGSTEGSITIGYTLR